MDCRAKKTAILHDRKGLLLKKTKIAPNLVFVKSSADDDDDKIIISNTYY